MTSIATLVSIARDVRHLPYRRRMPVLRAFSADPIGAENGKLGDTLGAYRRVGTPDVGGTCPPSCRLLPQHGGRCYTRMGSVRSAERRASAEVDAGIATAATAMVGAAAWYDAPARLLVSGDLGGDPASVDAYCAGLVEVATELRSILGYGPDRWLAWTYTHDMSAFDRWSSWLHLAGIAIRASDRTSGDWSAAVVGPRWEGLAELRAASDRPVAACPAQLGPGVTCAGSATTRRCGLCWERPDVLIAFASHAGAKAEDRTPLP